MRTLSILVVVLALALASVACGGKQEDVQKAAEQAAEQAKSGSPAGDAAAGMQQMADAFKQMADSGDLKEVEPVSFRDLQTVLPDFGGWEKGTPEGEKMSAPIAISRTQIVYTKDEMQIEASVVDTGNRQMFFIPYMMMMAAGYEQESSSGFEKGAMVRGNPGFEKWDSEAKEGQLAVAVNKRFFVQLQGRNINDNKVLHDFMGKVDLGKLADMK